MGAVVLVAWFAALFWGFWRVRWAIRRRVYLALVRASAAPGGASLIAVHREAQGRWIRPALSDVARVIDEDTELYVTESGVVALRERAGA